MFDRHYYHYEKNGVVAPTATQYTTQPSATHIRLHTVPQPAMAEACREEAEKTQAKNKNKNEKERILRTAFQ